jgi:hypothetical protein
MGVKFVCPLCAYTHVVTSLLSGNFDILCKHRFPRWFEELPNNYS